MNWQIAEGVRRKYIFWLINLSGYGLIEDWRKTYNGLTSDWQGIVIGLTIDCEAVLTRRHVKSSSVETLRSGPHSSLVPRLLTQLSSDWSGIGALYCQSLVNRDYYLICWCFGLVLDCKDMR